MKGSRRSGELRMPSAKRLARQSVRVVQALGLTKPAAAAVVMAACTAANGALAREGFRGTSWVDDIYGEAQEIWLRNGGDQDAPTAEKTAAIGGLAPLVKPIPGFPSAADFPELFRGGSTTRPGMPSNQPGRRHVHNSDAPEECTYMCNTPPDDSGEPYVT